MHLKNLLQSLHVANTLRQRGLDRLDLDTQAVILVDSSHREPPRRREGQVMGGEK